MTIVEGLIRIAMKMDIRIVAEGIESEEQAHNLQAIGCILGQGYVFSPAVDRDRTTDLLIERAQIEPLLKGAIRYPRLIAGH